MLPNQDETIVCADCGETFLFTAAEAAFYVQKNLAVPPKRCKACRAARKERAGDPRGPANAREPRRPRSTGDVNEYRSPMQDGGWSPPASAGRAPRRPRDAAPAARGATPAAERGHARGAVERRGAPAEPAAAPKPPRAHGAMFDVTCSTCGVQTQVPFRPIEGRDVFCQPCYRARKPT